MCKYDDALLGQLRYGSLTELCYAVSHSQGSSTSVKPRVDIITSSQNVFLFCAYVHVCKTLNSAHQVYFQVCA